MDIFFTDPGEIPLPPDEVRIRDLEVVPYPDGRRVRVLIELTPFQKYPSGEVTITDSLGTPVAVTSFIEAITPKLELTLHLRAANATGKYNVTTMIFYSQELKDEQQNDQPPIRPEKKVVDEKSTKFSIDLDQS